jgi:hypothetical protein
LTLSVFLFVTAQFLPALWPDMGAWNRPDVPALPGWLVTALAWPYYISNVVLLLGPLLIGLFVRVERAPIALKTLAAFYALTPLSVVLFSGEILGVAVGFYLWVGSFIASALAAISALPSTKTANKTKMATPFSGLVTLPFW